MIRLIVSEAIWHLGPTGVVGNRLGGCRKPIGWLSEIDQRSLPNRPQRPGGQSERAKSFPRKRPPAVFHGYTHTAGCLYTLSTYAQGSSPELSSVLDIASSYS